MRLGRCYLPPQKNHTHKRMVDTAANGEAHSVQVTFGTLYLGETLASPAQVNYTFSINY